MDGMIATNTTIQRPGLEADRVAKEAGGLSGAPLKPLALEALRHVRAAVGNDFPSSAWAESSAARTRAKRRAAGADLVQIYTGFIYAGPR